MTDPLEEKRQMFQLHKKGYEEIAKAVGDKKAFSINVNGKVKDVEIKSQKGDPGTPGKDGKTPVKGLDYFTKSEVQDIVDEILSKIRQPKDGKDGVSALVDYAKIAEFVKKEVSKIPKPTDGKDGKDGVAPVVHYDSIIETVLKKIPAVDYEPIKDLVRKEIQKLEESRPARTLNSGGPTTRLTEMSDVNPQGLSSSQVLSWDGQQWVPTTIVSATGTITLTNKRITKRVVTVTQSATPTINTDNTDVAYITGLAQAVTSFTTNLSGTPVNGDTLIIDITDNGTGRALTFGSSFEASTVALPTTTVASTKLTIGFRWNVATSKWTCVAVA